ncbi:hypothetical protein ACLOJK_004375 [Asimina triloba]
MDATAYRVSRPREDTARGEWRDGEERRTLPTLAFAPETFYPFPSSSPPVTISHRLLRPSSASVPVVYSIFGRPSPTFSPPLSTVVSLAPPIELTPSSAFVRISHCLLCSLSASGPAPFPASSPFLIGSPHRPRQSSPTLVPALSLSSFPFPTQ